MVEFAKDEKTGKMYWTVEEAYNLLLSYMNGTETNANLVIEEACGFLGEALSD